MSCNFNNIPAASYEIFRGFYPINSTTCGCYDYYGIGCNAWCMTYPVTGFEIVVASNTGTFSATCSTGKKVLGCHINPLATAPADMWRKYYPASTGTACTCTDKGRAECYATCASGIKDYEIISLHGSTNPTVVSCKIAGNVVLGCGHKPDATSTPELWPFVLVNSLTSCVCYFYYGSTCYAICGKLF